MAYKDWRYNISRIFPAKKSQFALYFSGIKCYIIYRLYSVCFLEKNRESESMVLSGNTDRKGEHAGSFF